MGVTGGGSSRGGPFPLLSPETERGLREPSSEPGMGSRKPGNWVGAPRGLRRAWQPTPVFLSGESPWTEEPGGLQSMGSRSQTQLKRLNMHAPRGLD